MAFKFFGEASPNTEPLRCGECENLSDLYCFFYISLKGVFILLTINVFVQCYSIHIVTNRRAVSSRQTSSQYLGDSTAVASAVFTTFE
jgi:hypothetical protein